MCRTRGSSSPSGSLSHKPPPAPVCSHPCPLPPSPASFHQDGPEEQPRKSWNSTSQKKKKKKMGVTIMWMNELNTKLCIKVERLQGVPFSPHHQSIKISQNSLFFFLYRPVGLHERHSQKRFGYRSQPQRPCESGLVLCRGEKWGKRKCSAESPALYLGVAIWQDGGQVFEESNPLFLL